MSVPISVIVSMAPRHVIAELARDYELDTGDAVVVEAVGGVLAKKRVLAGEVFDVVILASDAIDELVRSGHVARGSKVDVVSSGVAVAARAGAPRPAIGSEAALKRAVLAAETIGCSTGPSGAGIMALFERWGVADTVRTRIVTPPPGVAVGALVASGDVALGFQQLSELLHVEGIEILGPLPQGTAIVTTFSAGVATSSPRPKRARALIAFLASPAAGDAKRRQGMAPVAQHAAAPEGST